MILITKVKFDQIFKEHYADLCRFALSFIQNKQLTEDLVQDVFVKFWNNRKSIQNENNIKSYLITAVKYACIDFIRKKQRTSTYNIEELGDEIEPIEHEFSKHDIEEIKQEINQAIEALPSKCKTIFLLSREVKMSYAEISEELGISKKTVENQISIAIKKIRIQLKSKDIIYLLYFIYNL